MSPLIKALIVGVAAVAMSDFTTKTFSSENDSDTERMAWRYGGGAAGALVAAKLLKI
jgi:hypothetical protein